MNGSSASADHGSDPSGAQPSDAASEGDVERPSVVLVDDESDLLVLLERLLSTNGFEVVGTAKDGEAGIEAVAEAQPDVVLLDLRMPRLDGASALPTIVRRAPRTMITILSANLDSQRVEPLLKQGAFTAYDKGDLGLLAGRLSEDLASFQRVLEGQDDVPAWHRRYRRL